MDLRGINEVRPDGLAEAGAATAAEEGFWLHACSHTAAGGGFSLVGGAAPATRVRLIGTDAEDAATVNRAMVSASVLKLRGRGCGIVRIELDEPAAAASGWDGSGWSAAARPGALNRRRHRRGDGRSGGGSALKSTDRTRREAS